jgi:aromatic-L-amino-acid decarboxylase
VLTLGLGLDALRKIPTDDAFRMRADALEQAMAGDRAAGRVPCAVVATAGTTSTTSVDPIAEIAAVCARAGVWLHVDAAYAGAAAICPEHRPTFDGIECADTIVVNPHKWLFTPVDCSVLLARRPEALREAFSVVPEYLRSSEVGVTNLMDYGFQLGRRFRALKLWMVIRAYGVEGLRERIRAHCAMARRFADWVHGAPDFELAAPVPFSTVCFRHIGGRDPEDDDRRNERLLEAVNRAGAVFLSHTRLRGRYVVRLAVGNLRTREEHVERVWERLREEARRLAPES